MVMPANNTNVRQLAVEYPNRIGWLFGPHGWHNPSGIPYALDNGRFAVWSRGKKWDEAAFWKLIERARQPKWVVVPDVVGDASGTFREWDQWAPRLSGLPLAMAVQDGMTPDAVRRHAMPDVIFVGGTTNWKRNTIWQWCRSFSRVHVGRINTKKWLWHCHRCGAESCDGTGWFRGDQMQLRGLRHYLDRSHAGMGPEQLELAFSRYGFIMRKASVEDF